MDKKKYLVPSDLTVGQFVYVIRKRVKLSSGERAIFVFVNNAATATASLMSTIYEENKDEDGFLYIQYSGENTFGRRCLDDDLKSVDRKRKRQKEKTEDGAETNRYSEAIVLFFFRVPRASAFVHFATALF